jgi:hypothetical protein
MQGCEHDKPQGLARSCIDVLHSLAPLIEAVICWLSPVERLIKNIQPISVGVWKRKARLFGGCESGLWEATNAHGRKK